MSCGVVISVFFFMEQTPLFAKGDTVVVVKGDLTDLMGKVLRVRQVRSVPSQSSFPTRRPLSSSFLSSPFSKKTDGAVCFQRIK